MAKKESQAAAKSAETQTADVGTVSAGQPAGETAEQAAERKRAPASNFLPIVRGRLPLIFVHAVRYNEALAKMGNKDLAAKLGTSVGKVFDIRKGRNFGYVDASFKPSGDDVAAAQAWIEQVGGQNAKGLSAQGDKSLMTNLLGEYQKGGLATAEEAAAFSAARTASRTPGAANGQSGARPPATAAKAAQAEKQTVGGDADALLG